MATDPSVAADSGPRLDERLRALVKTLRVARQRLTIQDTQVQPGMIGILAAIGSVGEGDCCHLKELATRCALDASTVSRAVATLAERGLVRRNPDPSDARARILTLTAAGRAALAEVERRQARFLRETLRDWTDAEVDAFAVALTRFVDDLSAALKPASAPAAPPAGSVSPALADPSEPETPMLEAAL